MRNEIGCPAPRTREESRNCEEDRERGLQRDVELLARVKAALRCGEVTEPAEIVGVEPFDLAQRTRNAASIAKGDDQGYRSHPGERCIKVDVFHK